MRYAYFVHCIKRLLLILTGATCHWQSAQDSVLGNIRQPEKFKAAVAEMVADMQKIPAQLVSNAIKNLGTNVGASPEA